jgi:glycosyltransferase involved in cell wall biosynthesis
VRPLLSGRGVHLVIVGTGRGEAAVRAAAERHGVARATTFTGLRRDIPEVLAAADAFVAPTLQEGFPNVVLEAMAMACPVVVTDVAGNTEAVTHEEDGLVVPPADVEALRHALGRLLEEAALRQRLGRAARETVVGRFTTTHFVSGVQQLYDELLSTEREARAA